MERLNNKIRSNVDEEVYKRLDNNSYKYVHFNEVLLFNW
jgi:hypothetical protein